MSDNPQPPRFPDIQVGDFFSETQYYEILEIFERSYRARNERGYEVELEREVIEEGMTSARHFTEEREVHRNDLGAILESAAGSVFTVNFNKQAKDREICDGIFAALDQAELSLDAQGRKALKGLIRASVKESTRGDERTLIGRLTGAPPELGRSVVHDLQIEGEYRKRLVDHRKINWLILRGVKYKAT